MSLNYIPTYENEFGLLLVNKCCANIKHEFEILYQNKQNRERERESATTPAIIIKI